MRSLALPALALLLLALAPSPASAQGPWCGALPQVCQTTTEVTVTPPVEPVPPLQGFIALPITVRYTYVPTSFSLAPTPIQLSVVQSPSWASTVVSPSTVYAPVDFVPGSVQPVTRTMSAFLLIAATEDAPAFEQGIVEVVATARPNGNLLGSRGQASVPVQADYYAALALQTPNLALGLEAGKGYAVPLGVTNHGNALTRVTFEVLSAPQGVQVAPPGQLTLQSRQHGGTKTSADTAFGIGAPDAFEDGQVVLLARGAYALDERLVGGTARLVLSVVHGERAGVGVQSLGGASAGAASPLVFGLLAAGAAGTVLLERARRRRNA